MYNILLLLKNIFVVFTLRKNGKKNSDNLIKSIFSCGPIPIKFGQWYAMRSSIKNQYLQDKLLNTLENCPTHSLNYTKQIYLKDFCRNLDDDISLDSLEPFASGSVGQVYKGTCIKSNKKIVMKVSHPNLYKNIMIFHFLLIVLKFIFCCNNININVFIQNIKRQFDYEIEALNMHSMYNIYKNDDTIIIPKLINFSSNVIIMTYEDGISFDDIDKTDNNLINKLAFCLTSFQRQNSCIFGLIHGDLHTGNWKIRLNNNNDFKLIVLDFGIMYNIDKDTVKDWIKAFQYQNYPDLLKLSIHHSNSSHNEEQVNKIVNDNISCFKGMPNMMKVIQTLIPTLNKYNIYIKDEYISVIISFALTEKVVCKVRHIIYDGDNLHNIYISDCLDVIAFCKSKNTCIPLANYLENDIQNLKIVRSCNFDDLNAFYDLNERL